VSFFWVGDLRIPVQFAGSLLDLALRRLDGRQISCRYSDGALAGITNRAVARMKQGFSEEFILRYRQKYRKLLSKAVGRPVKAPLSTHEVVHKKLFSICTRKNLCKRTHLWPWAVEISTPTH
jgi:hypothetical protein